VNPLTFWMDLNTLDGYEARFETPDLQHNGERMPSLLLPRPVWNELGKPARITVEVTP